ncbi:zf-HC2 domain-containing protein [Micromonospora sp. NPDC047074]|uniref:zf-HC2 domain-containing protein n=1 Tax=Micromonospora sp. NPDC047074 TaxID=3154339 RepID=UPI0033E4D4E7
MRHPTDQLAGYVAGTLLDRDAAAVAAHLSRCVACRQDAAGWRHVAEGVRAREVPAPVSVLVAVRARIAASYAGGRAAAPPAYGAAPGAHPVARAVGVLAYQWRLVGWRVWGVCAVVLVAGLALAASASASAEPVLAVVVPLVAALAVAGAYGGDEPAIELIRATPTSVRTVLLARLTVASGAVFGAAAIGSLVLSLAGAGGAGGLLAAWLGPMVLLSAVSFALSVVWRPAVGLSVALALWVLRVLAASGSLDGAVSGMVGALWQTSWPTLAVAAAMLAGALAVAPDLPSPRVARLRS